MPKFIFILTGTNRNGPALTYFNVRGVSYKFFWNEKYRKHIFDNRELTAAEFNKFSEIFSGHDPMENACRAVGQVVEVEEKSTEDLEPTLSERRQFLQTIADLEAKLKKKHGGRPRKNPTPQTVS